MNERLAGKSTAARLAAALSVTVLSATALLAFGACGGDPAGGHHATYEGVRARETVARETVARETVARETVARETVAREGESGSGKELVVDHERIPGYMQAMRMTARLPASDTLAQRLARGDKIRMTLDVRAQGGETMLYASRIERLLDTTRLQLARPDASFRSP